MQKNSKITVRLTNKQLDDFKSEAKKLDITTSEYIRRASINNYYKDIAIDAFYDDILFQINKIGNNLNQIAHNTNITNKIDIQSLKSLVNIESVLNKILLKIKC